MKDNEKLVDIAIKALDEVNPDAEYLSEHTLSNVINWIDTGSYALNAIISGSLFKGIPVGRITGIYGPQSTGKTLIMNKIMANAQKMGFRPVYFDSENALDSLTAERLGCDIKSIKHVPIETIEDLKHQVMLILTKLLENNLKQKVIIFIDSLGNLSTKKEIEDSLKDNQAQDMGQRAKQISSFLRSVTYRAAKTETSIIFSNHIYDNPTEMYPSIIKKQAGGHKPLYLASLLIQLSAINEKASETISNKPINPLINKISGIYIKALTTKNRFIPPFLETKMYLNYTTGLSRYYGLLEIAEAVGFLKKEGNTYFIAETNEKLGTCSKIENNDDFWSNSEILNKIDKLLFEKIQFSKF